MAVLAFAFIGAQLFASAPAIGALSGAAIGTALGGALGSVVDSMFLFPAIFGQPHTEGPRMSDLKTQLATEGSPINFCLGPENRVAGTVIWMTDLKEHKTSHGGKGGGPSSTSYSYTVSFAVGLCEGPIAAVGRIWADGKLVYDPRNGGADKRAKSIAIYLGTAVQAADAVIQAIEGSVNVPAFRGTAYIRVEDLQLADFGNRLPQINVEVIAQKELPIRDGIAAMLTRAGLTTDQFNTDAVTGCLRGYSWAGPKAMQEAILPLLTAYSIRVQEADGVLRFFPRGTEDAVAVLETDLAATAASGGQTVDQVQFTDAAELSLPTACEVTYYDTEKDLQQGSQSAHRSAISGTNIAKLDLPIVLKSDEAQTIAARQLWTPWGERQAAQLNLPPSYLKAIESDVLLVPFKGQNYQVRVVEVSRGANFQREYKGLVQDPDTSNVFGSAEPTVFTPPTILDDQGIILALMDLPAMRTEDQAKPGIYLAACNQDTSDGWKGAAVFIKSPTGSYNLIETLASQAVMGLSLNRLNAGPTAFWDNLNSVDVELFSGELESATIDEVLDGANFALLGSEVFAFTTAELLSAGKYRLSGLLRGRRNTEAVVNSHARDEQFVLLSQEVLGRWATSASSLYATRYFEAIVPGGSLGDFLAVPGMASGANLKPFSPCLVRTYLEASGDLTITWIRRSRGVVNVFGPVDQLDLDSYDVEFAHENRVFRTLHCTTDACSVVWTAAMQATDAISGDLTITVYQKSKAMGRGNPGILQLTV